MHLQTSDDKLNTKFMRKYVKPKSVQTFSPKSSLFPSQGWTTFLQPTGNNMGVVLFYNTNMRQGGTG